MLRKLFQSKPRDRMTLSTLVRKEIARNGTHCSLNHIDVSEMTDMSYMFHDLDFQGDISQWNVSKVKRMEFMFFKSTFNGNISEWNVSNVTDMTRMFAHSGFNGDLSQWDIRNVDSMNGMFMNSAYRKDLSNWNVQFVDDMRFIFHDCTYEGDISSWTINPSCQVGRAFTTFHPSTLGICSFLENPSIKVPADVPNADRMNALRELWHSMGLTGLEQAYAFQQTLEQAAASPDIPDFEFSAS